MTGRSRDPDPLGPEERALWQRVTATVRALHRQAQPSILLRQGEVAPKTTEGEGGEPSRTGRHPPPPARARVTPSPGREGSSVVGDTLDGGWDRRLRRGMVAPDATIDLHGHTLASAHAALDEALARSLAMGDRLLLVITGRAPRPGGQRRGAIRAALPDWLTHSPHARRIAAVRAAHPRHGGAGALYLILRRER
ncbi:MAG: Smr/MutS family protein [Sphingomonadaceae bacterium]|nr:Smr/MutS family protein [Sphingomonadaceae bacterium]